MPRETDELEPESSAGPDAAEPPAESSAAKDEGPKSLLDAVKSAVAPADDEEGAKPAAESSAAEGEESETPPKGAKETEAGDAEEPDSDKQLLALLDQLKDKNVPLNKIERFREILESNRELKGRNESLTQLETRIGEINRAAARVGLTTDDLAKFYSFPMLLAEKPEEALKYLREITGQWEGRLGAALPDDLKKRVDAGYLDEESAKEIARLRAKSSMDEHRTKFDAEERDRDAQATRQKEIRNAVNGYQKHLMESDPDYTPEKHAMVADALAVMVAREGPPASTDAARVMAKKAYETVNERLKAFAPTRRSVTRTSGGRGNNRPAKSEPKTMLEAVSSALDEVPVS
jgi:hypothetical protein